MRKITTSLLAVVMLVAACSKKDIKTAEEPAVLIENLTERQCASHDVLEKELAENPQRAAFLNELERQTQAYINQPGMHRSTALRTIPVILHVLESSPNLITDAQIQSQIDVLNKDFTKANEELSRNNIYLANYPLSSVANCQINFSVKQVIRKTTSATFGSNNAVKFTSQGGSDAVNSDTHLNIWVCNLSSGLLGYAQFPGGNVATDGVVVDYQAFGTFASYSMYAAFNKGRTATHEVGHWLNLRHIWGDARCGNDGVSDTPSHDASNSGCPSAGLKSNCAGKPLEQWMNYMDYTNDACMYMFSAGQRDRMDAAILNSRSAYIQ
ncbi:zinc metalloprotease [Aridibaculum aurantiacum]|uniref:zinc metalloprotease n=1 Tax=Aridibaculum aurantiacum TaxID=2810307 RepID=UPI001A956DCC|nr:zinc metalloprotease [Aridibaculum aurantiacum]